jgi:hypothetical protein
MKKHEELREAFARGVNWSVMRMPTNEDVAKESARLYPDPVDVVVQRIEALEKEFGEDALYEAIRVRLNF